MLAKTKEKEKKRRGCVLSLDIGRVNPLNQEDMVLLRKAIQYFQDLNHDYNDPKYFVSIGRDNRMYCNAYAKGPGHQECPLYKLISTIERDDRYSPNEESEQSYLNRIKEENIKNQLRREGSL